MAGRLASTTDKSGLTTTYSYVDAANGRGTITTMTLPGGFTKITENYLDGSLKSLTGTAVPNRYLTYGSVSDGTRWMNETDATGSKWVKSYWDILAQFSKREESGFGGAIVTSLYTYNSFGLLTKVSKTGEPDTLFEYDELGNLVRSGRDIDGSGALELASSDRITDTDKRYVSENGTMYESSTTKTYGTAGSDTATILERGKEQLTNLASGTAQKKLNYDVYGNETVNEITFDRNAKQVILQTTYPDSTVSARQVFTNGLLTSKRSVSNLTTGYAFDGLERVSSITDSRTGTTTLSFFTTGTGKKGQLQSMTDPAGNTSSYDYDSATGWKIEERNALSKIRRFDYNPMGLLTSMWGDLCIRSPSPMTPRAVRPA